MHPQAPLRMPDWLARRAADHPDRPAIIAGCGADARRWSFAELDAATTRLADLLGGTGIGEADRVAVLLPNGPTFVTAVHALTRLGAILVPLNLRLAPAEIAWQIGHAHTRLLIHDPSTADLASAAIAAGGAMPTLALAAAPGDDLTAGRPGPATQTHIELGAVQCIMYTSGTTGRPKGALLTYANHWWSAVASALNLGLHEDDRWLVCLPLFHIGGLSILFRSAIYGMPIVFPESPVPGAGRSFDPAAVNRAILEHGATIISVVATQVQRLLETGDPPLPADGTLRCLLLGGGPAPRPLLEACAARGLRVVQTYGLTEAASQVATLAPADALRKLGSAGRPLLPNEVRIGGAFTTEAQRHRGSTEIQEEQAPDSSPGYPLAGRSAIRPQSRMAPSAPPPRMQWRARAAARPTIYGQVHAMTVHGQAGHGIPPQSEAGGGFAIGEILVRGPAISPGYLGDGGDLAAPVPAVDADGWFHTGDVGYLDGEGFLYVLDRRSDLIIGGGENVYPAEVEEVLLAHPAIAEAGVYGVPDPRWGQAVAAAVVPRPGMSIEEAEVLAFCRARLARYKVPSRLRVAATLPRNASGKLLRRALREASMPEGAE